MMIFMSVFPLRIGSRNKEAKNINPILPTISESFVIFFSFMA